MKILRRRLLAPVVCVLLAASLLAGCGGRAKPQYVIVILMDAVRPDHLSCYGYGRPTSPRIDELAGAGAVFEDAVAQAPWTLPSVATILSSKFPSQHGAERVGGRNVAMGEGQSTFVELLASEGYKTCALSTAKIFVPTLGLSQGFAESYIVGREPDVLEKVAAHELTDAAVTWLRQHKGDRCFLFIHHYDTHYPYKAGEQCTRRFNPTYEGPYRNQFGDSSLQILKLARAGRLREAVDLTAADIEQIKTLYDCEIIRTDAAIGRLVDSLAAWGCLEKSMLIVSADHGEEFLERGSLDHGQTVFDESIRVPLVVHCPAIGILPNRIGSQVGLIDLGPTILDVLGIEIPVSFEGRSLLGLMADGTAPPRHDLRPCGLPVSCLVSEAIAHRPEKKAVRCPPWKLVYDPFFGATELYNLREDPGEATNLIEVESETAANLMEILLASLDSYYPGGWCVAWRGRPETGVIKGKVSLGGGLIEVVGHGLYPDFDPALDSLVTSSDGRQITFSSLPDETWEGVEVRMPGRQKAVIDLTSGGKGDFVVQLGAETRQMTFPATFLPDQALVGRNQLHKLFSQRDADVVVFWVDPGSAPTATDRKQEDLRRRLKAIGYID
jgi:arylsulfatase A-like enzyme